MSRDSKYVIWSRPNSSWPPLSCSTFRYQCSQALQDPPRFCVFAHVVVSLFQAPAAANNALLRLRPLQAHWHQSDSPGEQCIGLSPSMHMQKYYLHRTKEILSKILQVLQECHMEKPADKSSQWWWTICHKAVPFPRVALNFLAHYTITSQAAKDPYRIAQNVI